MGAALDAFLLQGCVDSAFIRVDAEKVADRDVAYPERRAEEHDMYIDLFVQTLAQVAPSRDASFSHVLVP